MGGMVEGERIKFLVICSIGIIFILLLDNFLCTFKIIEFKNNLSILQHTIHARLLGIIWFTQ